MNATLKRALSVKRRNLGALIVKEVIFDHSLRGRIYHAWTVVFVASSNKVIPTRLPGRGMRLGGPHQEAARADLSLNSFIAVNHRRYSNLPKSRAKTAQTWPVLPLFHTAETYKYRHISIPTARAEISPRARELSTPAPRLRLAVVSFVLEYKVPWCR